MTGPLNAQSLAWGRTENNIRALSAYAAARKAEIGRENVFDFSIGNPSVPPPPCVDEAFRAVLAETDGVELHAYTPAPGLPSLRKAIAARLSGRGGAEFDWRQVYVTMGASAGLAAFCRAVLLPGDKAVAFAPYFMEYRVFAEAAGAKLLSVPPRDDMQPDLAVLEALLDEQVKLVDEEKDSLEVETVNPQFSMEQAMEFRPELRMLRNVVDLNKQTTNIHKKD